MSCFASLPLWLIKVGVLFCLLFCLFYGTRRDLGRRGYEPRDAVGELTLYGDYIYWLIKVGVLFCLLADKSGCPVLPGPLPDKSGCPVLPLFCHLFCLLPFLPSCFAMSRENMVRGLSPVWLSAMPDTHAKFSGYRRQSGGIFC